jgi:hypothetical protein
MMLQTEMANIPGELPLDHKLDSSALDKQAYITLKNLDRKIRIEKIKYHKLMDDIYLNNLFQDYNYL